MLELCLTNGNREQHLHAATIETCLDKTKEYLDLVTHCTAHLYLEVVNLLGGLLSTHTKTFVVMKARRRRRPTSDVFPASIINATCIYTSYISSCINDDRMS